MNRFPALETAFSIARGETGEVTVRLRPWTEDDIPTVTRACADALTQQWLPLPHPYTREDAAMFIAGGELTRLSGDGAIGAVTLPDGATVVGCVGLKHTDWRAQVTEVGYWAVPAHRGRGYITAATRAISLWALRQGMQRVELVAAPGNVASNRVALRAGFAFEGLKPEAGSLRGQRVDLNHYAMIGADARPTVGREVEPR